MLGFFVINKPTGMGSTQVVSFVKRITHQKAGHLGTLDPLASGVLPVAVGKATKLFDYFLKKDKEYFAIGKFGVQTDTLDSDGKIVNQNNTIIKKPQIDAILPQFLGEIDQIPPKFSSVKVSGVPSYKLARAKKDVELVSRKIEIYSITASEIQENIFAFKIHCSSGTYIRTLIDDIAKALGSCATTLCIIRTRSGPFSINSSVTLQELDGGFESHFVSVDSVIDLPKIELDKMGAQDLIVGKQVKFLAKNGEYLCYRNDNIIGIVEVENNIIKIKINLWEYSND